MFAQLLKKTLFSKIISFVVAFSFILTSVPVSYAGIERSDSLRPPAARGAFSLTSKIAQDFTAGRILVLGNNVSLHKGAQTGGTNIEHAILDGANGGIFNHSERRLRIENAMMNMLRGIRSIDKKSKEKIEAIWKNALKTENLSDAEIAATLGWLEDFQAKSRDEQAIERLGRRLTNYVINLQLKEVIAYSNKSPISQTVLCIGETHPQYLAKRTTEVLESDLEEMLDNISAQDAQKIGLRIAYEPRWAIGTGLTPTPDEIQSTHRFIKKTINFILGTELDVDYGGSLNKGNAERILVLPDVDGGLIGGAAKKPADILPVIEEAVKQGKAKNKVLNVGMNWKAEIEATGLAPITDFVELFLGRDLTGVRIVISTPQVATVRTVLTRQIRNIAGGADEVVQLPSNFLTIDDLGEIAGKPILVRPDLNAPVKDDKISTTDRIVESAPTIKELAGKGARVVVIAHQGRPGDPDYLESMEQHAALLSKEVGRPIKYVHDLYGKDAVEAIWALKDGEILMLKNLRPQEEDSQFLATLEPLFYAFVNDAFSVSHRKQAGIVGFAKIPNVAGRLMQREIEGNSRFLTAIAHPYIELLGGSKISDHLDALEYGLKNGLIDRVLTGGLLGQLLLIIDGYKLGEPTEKVLREQDVDKKARPEGLLTASFLERLKGIYTQYKDKFELPVDLAYVDEQGVRKEILVKDLPKGGILFLIGDNGTQTAEKYAGITENAKTAFEKGPMGNYKKAQFRQGSEIVYKAVAENVTFWMTGGGDTDVLNQELGLKPTHKTLAGGAYLEFKAGKVLPGLVALDKSAENILQTTQKLNVDKRELLSYLSADKTIYTAEGGEAFDVFVNDVDAYLQTLSPEALKNMKTQAIIVDPNFFRAGGVKGALETVAKLSRVVRIALYGENADKIKTLIGNKNIIIARDIDSLYSELSRLSIGNTIVLRSQDELPESVQLALKKAGDAQIVSSQLATLAVARAIKELLNVKEIDGAFEKFLNQMRTDNVISEKAYNDNRATLLAKLEKGKVFEFSPDLKPAPEITEKTEVEAARRKSEEFLTKIGV